MIELNVIVPLVEDYGIHGGYIKVVGTSFKNTKSSLPRHVTIRGFFERNTSKSTYSSDLRGLTEDIDIRIIKEIEAIQREMNRFVKVQREYNNIYDPNAIAVYVDASFQFIKIGYFPKDLSELIVTNKFKYYVVGFERSGKGMTLTMVFSSPDILVGTNSSGIIFDDNCQVYDKKEVLAFMSLNKIRRKLCK